MAIGPNLSIETLRKKNEEMLALFNQDKVKNKHEAYESAVITTALSILIVHAPHFSQEETIDKVIEEFLRVMRHTRDWELREWYRIAASELVIARNFAPDLEDVDNFDQLTNLINTFESQARERHETVRNI